jgi:UDP-N-acetylbacillosamine N-acetyltransferase
MSHPYDLCIIGGGGHARSIADVALRTHIQRLLFVDKFKAKDFIMGFPCHSDLLNDSLDVIVGIGDNLKRSIIADLYKEKLVNVISLSAYISRYAVMGNGNFVGEGSHIGVESLIGYNNIINTHAVIEHECVIGNHTHISVNATILGKCKIGDFTFIGAGSVVRDCVSICNNVIVGAGSTVVKDIKEPGVYVGSPCVRIK